jgi:anti-sigma B factor antagonist
MTDLVGHDHPHNSPFVSEQDDAPSHLAATVVYEPNGAVVSVAGEMDLASAPAFQRQVLALFALPVESMTVDLAGLSFIDSSGLRALVTIHDAAQEHRIPMSLRSVPRQARRVLELTNLAQLFAVGDADEPPDGFG